MAFIAVALAHSDETSENGEITRSLVVCPSTLVGHWKAEVEKFFSDASVFKPLALLGTRKERVRLWKKHVSTANLVVTSYANLRSDIDYLEGEKWCYCVLDEGHLLKNPKTGTKFLRSMSTEQLTIQFAATAQAARRIQTRHKLILTGTPIQNRVHELWATFDFLMPNFLGTSKSFQKEFANPIAKSQLPGSSAQSIADGIVKLKLLHQQVLPFILRREKEQVLPELPPKTLTTIRVPMSNVQARTYRDFCVGKGTSFLQSIENAVENAKVDSTTAIPSFSKDVLKSLLFLRLLCTHPTLVLTENQRENVPDSWKSFKASGKMQALAEILKEAGICEDQMTGADQDESLLYIGDTVEETNDEDVLDLPESSAGTLIASPATPDMKFSSASKCLIFAQFTKSLDALEELVFRNNMPDVNFVRLDGTVSASKRMQIVDSFNEDPSIRVMLLTTRVGGLGLNLTAANIVIFLENDYNPFADIQAIDRTRRIGQQRVVNVYRIVTCDSIEEQILRLQEKKIAVSEAVVNSENSSMYSMGTDRLLDIFNTRTEDDEAMKIDFDLEGLLEQCAKDYASLTVSSFSKNHEKSTG